MDEQITESGEYRLAWYRTGKGKPLVMLHGWGSNATVMKPLAGKMAAIRTCYLVDFPGFGNSPPPPEPWSVGDYADAIERWISEVIPGDEAVDLLVHSFGARVALKLLVRPRISGRIDKVVFTGGAGLKPRRTLSFYIKKYAAKLLKAPFILLPGTWRESALQRLRKTVLWRKLGSSDYQQLSGVMRSTFVKTVTEHLDALLPQIRHEILLIWGENDTATPLEQAERFDRELNQSALVVVKNAGHYVFLDQPARFSAIVRAYLEPKQDQVP